MGHQSNRKIRIRSLYPNFFSDTAIANAALMITGFFNSEEVFADLMGTSSEASVRKYQSAAFRAGGGEVRFGRPTYRDAIAPGPTWAVARRILSPEKVVQFAEWRFLSSLRAGDIAYLWPGTSLKLFQAVKDRGIPIVTERVNTLLPHSTRIMDAEFARMGVEPIYDHTAQGVREELACMELADFIFSPSPAVTASILEVGIPERKVIETSYGLDDRHFLNGRQQATRPLTALFAGTICFRKGVHLLLEAWKRAEVDGRLVIVGRIASEMEEIFAQARRDDPRIDYREYVTDLEPIYRDADYFVLPSLEEGSPLVTYLALGAGLPFIVSPMGSGGVVRDEVDGRVIDPHDTEGFAEAIRFMVRNESTREAMAAASHARAGEFHWRKVALRRLEILLERLDRSQVT